MSRFTTLFHATIALQGARNFKADHVVGLSSLPEGEELAKAFAESLVYDGPESAIEAMMLGAGGNQDTVAALMGGIEELAKAHVERHTRTLHNGKVVDVKAYESSRKEAMDRTAQAHGATFRAMRAKTAEEHRNAAKAHEEAHRAHSDAHDLHPRDVPEAGDDHAKLRGGHAMARDYHTNEADRLQAEESYNRAKTSAEVKAGQARAVHGYDGQIQAHQEAAKAHHAAEKAGPDRGHKQTAFQHHAEALALTAERDAGRTTDPSPQAHDAGKATADATAATRRAHEVGDAKAHKAASAAHLRAAEAHRSLGPKDDAGKKHHEAIAQHHAALALHHEGHAIRTGKAEAETVAKAEPMVQAYETHAGAASDHSSQAMEASGKAERGEDHAQAAGAHQAARELHQEAAKHAPESWQKEGHQKMAEAHAHFAESHTAKARAANFGGDTGVDIASTTPADIRAYEGHEDMKGHGYLGHPERTDAHDKALAEAASKSNVDRHHLAAWMLSAAGRKGMPPKDAEHEDMVKHFTDQLTSKDVTAGHRLKEYADDLRERTEEKPAKA